jgi:hypothetical protein
MSDAVVARPSVTALQSSFCFSHVLLLRDGGLFELRIVAIFSCCCAYLSLLVSISDFIVTFYITLTKLRASRLVQHNVCLRLLISGNGLLALWL